MRYLSVCSGVEAASVAWEHLGWTPVGFSEIEPFPSAVLKHRFPNVLNFGDMTKYKEWPIEPGTVDVLVGGTPCQSFSVAGLRKGLDDPRGNLMLVYLGLAEHFRVPWLVWENVPGVLSSNGGRDFGTFLGALGELGYRWSFRVLDAQYFGVPQRRRRVFVVAHLGDGAHPAKVLFEPESLRGDSAPRRKAREGSSRGARPGAESGGRVGVDIVGTLCSDTHPGAYSGQDAYTGRIVPQVVPDIADTVTAKFAKGAEVLQQGARNGGNCIAVTQLPIGLDEEQNAVVDGFGTLKARMLGGGFEGTVAVSATGPVTHALTRSQKGATEDGTGRGTPIVPCVTGSVTHTLKADGFDGSEDGTGRGTPIVPAIAFHPTQDPISSVEVTHAMGTGSRQGTASVAVATAYAVHGEHSTAMQSSNPATLVARPVEVARCLDTTGGYATSQGGTVVGQEITGTLSSRATAGGGLGTDFEVAGGLQPTYTEDLQACAEADTLVLEDLNHADAAQADARKVLRTVLDEIGAEAFTEWGLGVAASLQSQEVLQQYLHGQGVRRETATQPVLGCVSLPRTEDDSTGSMRGLRATGCARRSPCGWGSHEQRHQELAAYLSGLSHPSTSWRQVVQAVRATLEGFGVLHDALSSVQEMGRPADGEGQPVRASSEGHGSKSDTVMRCFGLLETVSREWLLRSARATSETRKVVMSCRRLMPVETERLQGFPDNWTLIPWKGKPASECPDGPRYKAMGNSMAVPVMRWIGEKLDRVVRGEL